MPSGRPKHRLLPAALACLLGSALQPTAAPGARARADEEADELDLIEIKQALLEDQRAREEARPARPAPAPPPGTARRGLWELLPEPGAILTGSAWYAAGAPRQVGDLPGGLGSLLAIELSLSQTLDPYLRLDAYAVLGTSGVSLLEAYASTIGLPLGLGVRTGLLLHRFGLQNRWHPHSFELVERPIALSRIFGTEGGGGLGAEVSALLPLPWYAQVAAAVLDASGAARARSFFGADAPPRIRSPLDLLYVVTLKQLVRLHAALRLQLGLSAAFGPHASGRDNRTDIYGVDVLLCHEPSPARRYAGLCVLGEWLLRRRQVPGAVLEDIGGYVEARLDLLRRLLFLLRYELGTGIPGDPLDPAWELSRHRAALGLSLSLSPRTTLRLMGSLDVYQDRLAACALLGSLILRVGAHGRAALHGPLDLDN